MAPVNIRPQLLAPLAACLTAFAVTTDAQQQAVPTDTELRSAYCMSVIKAEVGVYQRGAAKADAAVKNASTPEQQQWAAKISAEAHEELTKLEAALDRLQLYLLPRLQARDPVALAAAMKRGDADFQGLMTMGERCPTKCGGPQDDKWRACMNSCLDKDLQARVRACDTPTWLPF